MATENVGLGAADVYRGFIEAVNRKDLDAAQAFVDPGKYRENCISFTKGYVGWEDAKSSLRQLYGKALGLVGLDAMFLRQ
jgi:hypothetical protein